MVLIFTLNSNTRQERTKWFPSPCGDYGSYHTAEWMITQNKIKSFRPLAGIMVLIYMVDADDDALFNEDVSVPLRGLWFLSNASQDRTRQINCSFRPLAGIMVLIGKHHVIRKKTARSFRPLAGIMVLIRTLYKCLYEAVEMAFCGADHIFSSFFVFCRKMIFKKLLRTEF